MKILSIIEELANEPSTNAKVSILQREKDNKLLKRVFQLAYNPMVTYGIKQIPHYTTSGKNVSLNDTLDELQPFIARQVTGNNAIDRLTTLLSDLSQDDAVVLERIIQRDLRCNTSDTLASRVWPGLVPTFDVMLSHKDISGIKFPAYAQVKLDGARAHMTLQAGKAVAFSRNGKPIELHGMFDESLANMVKEGETLDGELLVMQDGKILDRKTGNGIVNKAVKGTISKEEAEMLVYHAWDIVDFTSTIPYSKRIERLTNTQYNDKIKVLQTHIVNTKEEAQEFFETCISAGEEGAMIKNMDMVWEPKRSKNIGKMKAEEVADLVVVGIEEGTGKNAGRLGALVCETADKLLRVNVGTGFSDEQRDEYFDYSMIGRIVEVMYNQKIQDKNGGPASLFLPRFLGVRFDKDVANSLPEVK
jgi:ATP-dependent DNA ligase